LRTSRISSQFGQPSSTNSDSGRITEQIRHALKSALRVLGGIVFDVRCELVDSELQAADFTCAPTDIVYLRDWVGTGKRLCVTVMGKCLDILRLPLDHVSSLAILVSLTFT
jgi:hypothetical protein